MRQGLPLAVPQKRLLAGTRGKAFGNSCRPLEVNPRPSGIKKLEGEKDLYRLRVGDFRVIYMIKDQTLLVLVLKIGHRKDVDRG